MRSAGTSFSPARRRRDGRSLPAHDSKLGRDVAIKVLPREFTSDSGRLHGFEREARMLAALNHPNICGIYGFEEADSTRFLVLELVEGDTLAARLGEAGVPLPVHEALTIARQIAEALEVAHERGVVHRDLKPSNIKITPAGVVKVLDFGLAKSLAGSGAGTDLTHAPGEARGVRRSSWDSGLHESEQARGLAVDKRTDIWSFGVVLFELPTGKRPFRGETATDTLASILKTEPDWTELPPAVAADLRRLLHRCLQKDPKRRLQSIADARAQVEHLLRGNDDDPFAADGFPASADRRFASLKVTRPIVAWTVAAIATIVAAALGASMLRRPDQPRFVFMCLPHREPPS